MQTSTKTDGGPNIVTATRSSVVSAMAILKIELAKSCISQMSFLSVSDISCMQSAANL
jgi:hypothetical protein